MKIPLSWLNVFIQLDLSPQQIAKTLTMLGLEVESIHVAGPSFSDVVVAKVVDVQKHPNADSLVVARVFDGAEEHQVVCGAPNCRLGLKTAFAKVGAVLQEGEGKTFKIKKTALRGVDSYGMLCSAAELQIGQNDDGIIEFASQILEGADVAQMYADTIFEISLTPNLGHCASVYGVARELSAALGVKLMTPWEDLKTPTQSSAFSAAIHCPEQCPRYTCGAVRGVTIGPSAEWMQKRLMAAGLRPINNVVDVTNYVLLEMGQPMHAFDAAKLHGKQIHVRLAEEGSSFQALDGTTRQLTKDDVVICDEQGPIALGGVMGGDHSKVTAETREVVLESASFHPAAIRKTSRRLGLMSDSSLRFEKGVSAEYTAIALMRALDLLQQMSGGEIVQGIADAYPGSRSLLQIQCRLKRVHQLLGIQLSTAEIEMIFQRLGMQTEFSSDTETYTVTVPAWRQDIKEEVDLIEEIARLYGYDNIPRKSSKYRASSLANTPMYSFEQEVRTRLVAEGLQEFITSDLISPSQIKHGVAAIPPEEIIHVLNPSSIEQSVLRPSLLPGLLQVAHYNISHQNTSLLGFEIGRIHHKRGDHYYDQPAVGILFTGDKAPYDWKTKSTEFDFYDLKGIVENLLTGLQILPWTWNLSEIATLHPYRQIALTIENCEIGAIGEVHPEVLKKFDIDQRIYFAEFHLSNLIHLRRSEVFMKPLSIYPSSSRDWTVTVHDNIELGKILKIAQGIPSRLLQDVSLMDIYRGGKLQPDQKNLTLRFVYRDEKKTLSQQAVDAEHGRIVNYITESLSRD